MDDVELFEDTLPRALEHNSTERNLGFSKSEYSKSHYSPRLKRITVLAYEYTNSVTTQYI